MTACQSCQSGSLKDKVSSVESNRIILLHIRLLAKYCNNTDAFDAYQFHQKILKEVEEMKVGSCRNLNIYKRMSKGPIWGLCVWICEFMRREGVVEYLQNRWETNLALFSLQILEPSKFCAELWLIWWWKRIFDKVFFFFFCKIIH